MRVKQDLTKSLPPSNQATGAFLKSGSANRPWKKTAAAAKIATEGEGLPKVPPQPKTEIRRKDNKDKEIEGHRTHFPKAGWGNGGDIGGRELGSAGLG